MKSPRWTGGFSPLYTTHDKGHGRIERRTIQLAPPPWWLDPVADGFNPFPYAEQVFRIHRQRFNLHGDPLSEEVVYGITSLRAEQADEAQILDFVRGHWTIENSIHYVRDWTWDEDRSQVRKGSGPRTMATLRNLAISLIKLHGFKNVAQATRRLQANPPAILDLLGIPA